MTLAVMILALAMQTHVKLPSCSSGDYYYAPATKEQCRTAGGKFHDGIEVTLPTTRVDGSPCEPTDAVVTAATDNVNYCVQTAPAAEPMDVPAVQERYEPGKPEDIVTIEDGTEWHHSNPYHATCADKSRVLLTSEDGKKHCILFPK